MVEQNDINEVKPDRMKAPNKEISSRPPRIVVAEDDEEMAALLVRAFEREGCEVIVCYNGWDLLNTLGLFPASGSDKGVELVVSDIRLPGISGLEVLKTCGYAGRFLPIILITAFGDNWTHEEARRLGAVDMLDKPFDIDELVDIVRRFLNRGD